MASKATYKKTTVKYTGSTKSTGSISTTMPCNVCHGTGVQTKPHSKKK